VRNLGIAKLFNEIADLLEIKDENVFKIRAYRRAAMNLESLTEEIEAVAGRRGLTEIAGIGKDLAAKIEQALETGRIDYLDELRKEIPRGVVELMEIPGVGPKTAKLLFETLHVDSVERLEPRPGREAPRPAGDQTENHREHPEGDSGGQAGP
jgi:DNA polymerase (family 10)